MIDAPLFRLVGFTVTAGPLRLLDAIHLDIPGQGVFGLIGPSGAGKSTLLKSLNRLSSLTPGLTFAGQIYFRDQPLYHPDCDPDFLRTRIGLLFQSPVLFPVSILENVLFGMKRLGLVARRAFPEAAEKALREAALWDEVKDRLHAPARQLSTGQQQRLCLARTLACRPEVLLMDEPTSALDPRATAAIEDLILDLKSRHPILMVTHHHAQAARLCDRLALLSQGHLVTEGEPQAVVEAASQIPSEGRPAGG
jgi:phosphate transport system ATP-binding protein